MMLTWTRPWSGSCLVPSGPTARFAPAPAASSSMNGLLTCFMTSSRRVQQPSGPATPCSPAAAWGHSSAHHSTSVCAATCRRALMTAPCCWRAGGGRPPARPASSWSPLCSSVSLLTCASGGRRYSAQCCQWARSAVRGRRSRWPMTASLAWRGPSSVLTRRGAAGWPPPWSAASYGSTAASPASARRLGGESRTADLAVSWASGAWRTSCQSSRSPPMSAPAPGTGTAHPHQRARPPSCDVTVWNHQLQSVIKCNTGYMHYAGRMLTKHSSSLGRLSLAPCFCRRISVRAAAAVAAMATAEPSSCWDTEHGKPLLSVAPMMDWTDVHYRQLARIISRRTWLWTEMVVDKTIIHTPLLDKFLWFPPQQHPIVLQLGGSDPQLLRQAAQVAARYGYDEINLNCGCPSDRVAGAGCFGAAMMLQPELVADCMAAIAEGAGPGAHVSVKCRLGVDDADSYEQLARFVQVVSRRGGASRFVIHARKCLLRGLSPAQNRSVPPLRHDWVWALKRDFPNLSLQLNGGVSSAHVVSEALALDVAGLGPGAIDGVMVGRAAYNDPWGMLGDADVAVFGAASNAAVSRRQVIHDYCKYADDMIGRWQVKDDGHKDPSIRVLVKPLLNLFHGDRGGKRWKNAVDGALKDGSHASLSDLMAATLVHIPEEVLDAPPKPAQQVLLAQNNGVPPEPYRLQQQQLAGPGDRARAENERRRAAPAGGLDKGQRGKQQRQQLEQAAGGGGGGSECADACAEQQQQQQQEGLPQEAEPQQAEQPAVVAAVGA